MTRTHPFSAGMHAGGAYVVADQPNLCPGCMSDEEVDHNIRRLKQLLDRAAVQMKADIKDLEGKDIL